CPKAYSYAYDDASSTFTCSGADYSITFCPTSSSSLKSAADSSTNNTKGTGLSSGSGSRGGSEQSEVANDSLMAYMATASGASTTMFSLLLVVVGFIFSICGCFVFPS
ncbi:thaumatin-like protein 1-like, partial [Trifolium medium]|nr:thaumatin-like protein 1-like [Trifolium medium]